MDFSWGGEALGARTHGGHVPPHRATGSAEDSTASVLGAQPMPSSWCKRERGSGGKWERVSG
jgi:hypothetical protein